MFTTISFPVVDFRLLNEAARKLQLPAWPNPDTVNGKMRYFGIIMDRSAVHGPWDGEQRYCEAKSVFNFCGLHDDNFRHSLQVPFEAHIFFRRFQSDGSFLAKFELGFDDQFESRGLNTVRQQAQLYEQVQKYLRCKLKIKTGKKLSPFMPLAHVGRNIANAFYWSSSYRSRTFEPHLPVPHIESDEPMLIVQVDSRRFSSTSLTCQKIESPELARENIELFFDHIVFEWQRRRMLIKTWFVLVPESPSTMPRQLREFKTYNRVLRSLRINLLRIHAEKVVLKHVTYRILNKQEGYELTNKAVQLNVQARLHKALKNLSGEVRNNISQTDIVRIVFKADEAIDPNGLENLLDDLKTIIQMIDKSLSTGDVNNTFNFDTVTYIEKIKNLVMGDQIKGNTVHGDLINRSKLIDSKNIVYQSNHSNDVKEELRKIADLIEQKQNITAAALFDKLNTELAKPEKEQDKSKAKKIWDALKESLPDVLAIGKTLLTFFA